MYDGASLDIMWFISVMVLMMSLVLVLAGAFTLYFGSGKSRAIGGALFAAGLVIGVLYVLMASSYWPGTSLIDVPIKPIIIETAYYVVAIAIGAVVGIGLFLGAIMKA